MKTKLLIILTLFTAANVYAGSATWNLNPASGDWNTAANWTPNTIPNGADDVATLELSNQTAIAVSVFGTETNELIFNPGASAFTITVNKTWTLSGTGITNDSGITQHFVVSSFYGLILTNGATAGDMTYFYLAKAGSMQFHDTSNAFLGTFVLEGSDSVSVSGGTLSFSDDSSAGNATLTVNGGNAPSSSSGIVSFLGGTADNGVFILNGGTADRALGGRILIRDGSAGNATVIANPGTNGGYGGAIQFDLACTPTTIPVGTRSSAMGR